MIILILECSDADGWVTGMASDLLKVLLLQFPTKSLLLETSLGHSGFWKRGQLKNKYECAVDQELYCIHEPMMSHAFAGLAGSWWTLPHVQQQARADVVAVIFKIWRDIKNPTLAYIYLKDNQAEF